MKSKEKVKESIHALYNHLTKRQEKKHELLDITDVLLQVYTKINQVEHPGYLVNRLVNYIRMVSLKGKIQYSKEEENLMNQLADFSKDVGLNGVYRGNLYDKSQFFDFKESDKLVYRD